ncbi:PEP-CTERM sorting domain-containing protein [Paludisphaera rhizosphaerae]|uniref:PEP-CTERM sorting domain-containing protein n=1 Tax=Paludisphaera rhizosphaerae TaxID=2711216 RepID=UPI0013ED52EC|nr:PEP-CTERM sorting domain-containing protein [Paludisphaera rhizosphaerae]
MHRMRNQFRRRLFPLFLLALGSFGVPLRAELIRPHGFRAYPNIAGELAGEQTYRYDERLQRGVFRVTNAPHVIALGPSQGAMVDVLPDVDGTLNETLQITLDSRGRLIHQPGDGFELWGSVTIGGKIYKGLLLTARPTAFGAQARGGAAGVFDLSLKVTGGELEGVFGPEAYFRITPQGDSTFQGDFGESFAGGRPQTSLRATRGEANPVPVPEPTFLVFLGTCGGGLLIRRGIRRRRARRRQAALAASVSRPGATPTTCQAPRSRSAGRAPSSARATRRFP